MLNVSGLQSKLAKIQKQDGSSYVIYGDPAYGVSRSILAPFRGSRLTAQQEHFNKAKSRVCISVEWTFGKIVSFFLLGLQKKQQSLTATSGQVLFSSSATY